MFKFIYNFLFMDDGKISHTKFWSNLGYGIMCWSFVHVVLEGSTAINYELWLLFGVVVIGNRTLKKKLLEKK